MQQLIKCFKGCYDDEITKYIMYISTLPGIWKVQFSIICILVD